MSQIYIEPHTKTNFEKYKPGVALKRIRYLLVSYLGEKLLKNHDYAFLSKLFRSYRLLKFVLSIELDNNPISFSEFPNLVKGTLVPI